MLTLVVTPSMRAHLDHAAERRGNTPYAYPIREAVQKWLDSEDPLTPEELKQVTDQYQASRASKTGGTS